MEIKIRDLPEKVIAKLNRQARQQNLSREELIRRILITATLSAIENQPLYFKNEVSLKLAAQLQKNIKILETVQAALEKTNG